ncbi:MAG: hypothetical protein OHK0032_00220 [Thermodesulfovibrionales bacterium]
MLLKTQKENWASISKKRNRGLFSELDVLLRALDRFFNIENLPIPKDDIANKNFFYELSAARDTILRIIGLLEVIIPENKRNIYWFQKFAQTKFMTDKKRDALREELYKQDIPEKSLLLLYDSFINLKGIITDILKTEFIPYLTYVNIGGVVGKELRENIYLNPFKKDLNPDFDVIENREVSRIVKSIKEHDIKKCISVMLLYLFKFLRFLRYADTSNRFGSLNPSLLIILLLRSEIDTFRGYIDKTANDISDEGLRMLINVISYQFSMESKRVFLQELRDIFRNRSSQYLKGKIENSHGILKNLSEQGIVQLVQFFDPDIKGREIFESFVTKLEQSLKLREDLYTLQRFLTLLENAETEDERLHIFDAMRNFMLYFQSFTFRLLRYEDYEDFVSFFDKVLALKKDDIGGKGSDKILDRIRHFRVFIETCLRQLSNRSELADRPIDMKRVDNSLNQYLL